MRSNSSLLWTLGFEIAYRLEIKDRGTGQCPDCFTIVFEIFEMIFLPIHVSRWSWQMPARLLSNAERMSLRCSLSRRCSFWPSLMPNSSKRYSMTWSSDMLLLRSSSYSRHEMFSPRGGSTSSEHKGIRIVVVAIGQTFFLRWILLLCAAETLEEDIVVFCIFKDALAVDATHHDMINSCARLDAAFPWHDTILFGTPTCPLCPWAVNENP